MNKVALITPYYGKWPLWMPFFLKSCEYNVKYDFLLVTDLEQPENCPENVIIIKLSFDCLIKRVQTALNFAIDIKTPYKLCDLRPAYGIVFQDYLRGYEFWGQADIDLIYGDIARFLTIDILTDYDVISCRRGIVSGQFSIYRNTEKINNLFKQIPQYPELLNSSESHYVDEQYMFRLLHSPALSETVKCYFAELLTEDALNEMRNRKQWILKWKNGKLYDLLLMRQTLLFHFILGKKRDAFLESCLPLKNISFYITEKGFEQNINIVRLSSMVVIKAIVTWKYIAKRFIKRTFYNIKDF